MLSESPTNHGTLWSRRANQSFILGTLSGKSCFAARTDSPPRQHTRPKAPQSSSSTIRQVLFRQEPRQRFPRSTDINVNAIEYQWLIIDTQFQRQPSYEIRHLTISNSINHNTNFQPCQPTLRFVDIDKFASRAQRLPV